MSPILIEDDIVIVKKLLGHSSILITEKYYIYVFPEDLQATTSLLNDFCSQKTIEKTA